MQLFGRFHSLVRNDNDRNRCTLFASTAFESASPQDAPFGAVGGDSRSRFTLQRGELYGSSRCNRWRSSNDLDGAQTDALYRLYRATLSTRMWAKLIWISYLSIRRNFFIRSSPSASISACFHEDDLLLRGLPLSRFVGLFSTCLSAWPTASTFGLIGKPAQCAHFSENFTDGIECFMLNAK